MRSKSGNSMQQAMIRVQYAVIVRFGFSCTVCMCMCTRVVAPCALTAARIDFDCHWLAVVAHTHTRIQRSTNDEHSEKRQWCKHGQWQWQGSCARHQLPLFPSLCHALTPSLLSSRPCTRGQGQVCIRPPPAPTAKTYAATTTTEHDHRSLSGQSKGRGNGGARHGACSRNATPLRFCSSPMP